VFCGSLLVAGFGIDADPGEDGLGVRGEGGHEVNAGHVHGQPSNTQCHNGMAPG